MPISPTFRKKTHRTKPKSSSYSSTIKNRFESYLTHLLSKKDIQRLAEATGFVKRSSSQLDGNIFVRALLTAALDTRYYSLEGLCGLIRELDRGVDIRPQSLMERINKPEAAAFLEAVEKRSIERQIQEKLACFPSALLKKFPKLLIQDSTVINLHEKLQTEFKGSGGRASKSALKIDLIYDLVANKIESTILTDMRRMDQTLAREVLKFVEKDHLVIRDLGYSNYSNLEDVQKRGGFFLCRFKSGLLVYLHPDDKDPIDLAGYINKKYRHENVIDLEVYITTEKFKVRMIAYRAPQEVVDTRRRKANATAKKQGRALQKSTLDLMSFTILLTNVSREIWKAKIVGSIYRLRWMIELVFKQWKSEIKVDYLPGINRDRIKCLIFSKLLAVTIMNQAYRLAHEYGRKQHKIDVSISKAMKWLRNNNRLANVIKMGWNAKFAELFLNEIKKTMAKQNRRRKTILQVVEEGLSYVEGMELA